MLAFKCKKHAPKPDIKIVCLPVIGWWESVTYCCFYLLQAELFWQLCHAAGKISLPSNQDSVTLSLPVRWSHFSCWYVFFQPNSSTSHSNFFSPSLGAGTDDTKCGQTAPNFHRDNITAVFFLTLCQWFDYILLLIFPRQETLSV